MKTRTMAWGVACGTGTDSRPRTRDQTACALVFLRKPSSLTAILALAPTFCAIAYLRFGWAPKLWSLVPLLVALAVIIVLDIRTKVIPDAVTLPGIAYALAVTAFVKSPSIGQALLGAVVGGGIVFLIAVISRGAIGGGDIKLMSMLGAALGWKGALVVLAFSQMLAALVALGLLIARRAGRHDLLPVGAIISLLGALMLLGGS
jgi:leader peptidase (prepilin peptidase) / N-methyltransferase